MTQGKPRDPRKELFWRDTLARWQASGLSIRAFCARHRLTESAFHAWRRTLAQRDRDNPSPRSPTVTFVPLQVQHDLPCSPPALELVCRHGRLLRIPADFPVAQLRAVLAVLEEPAC
jgi:transposase-like protein